MTPSQQCQSAEKQHYQINKGKLQFGHATEVKISPSCKPNQGEYTNLQTKTNRRQTVYSH